MYSFCTLQNTVPVAPVSAARWILHHRCYQSTLQLLQVFSLVFSPHSQLGTMPQQLLLLLLLLQSWCYGPAAAAAALPLSAAAAGPGSSQIRTLLLQHLHFAPLLLLASNRSIQQQPHVSRGWAITAPL